MLRQNFNLYWSSPRRNLLVILDCSADYHIGLYWAFFGDYIQRYYLINKRRGRVGHLKTMSSKT